MPIGLGAPHLKQLILEPKTLALPAGSQGTPRLQPHVPRLANVCSSSIDEAAVQLGQVQSPGRAKDAPMPPPPPGGGPPPWLPGPAREHAC
eukprot:scaffold35332_cov54-Phaeocystis_antarctica.AAC.4